MNTAKKEDLAACAQICLDCSRVCAQTLTSCLGKGGPHAEVGHIQELVDGILMCQTTACLLLRGSNSFSAVCASCAEVCDRCANGCEGWNDPEMDLCAVECRSCSEGCRSLT